MDICYKDNVSYKEFVRFSRIQIRIIITLPTIIYSHTVGVLSFRIQDGVTVRKKLEQLINDMAVLDSVQACYDFVDENSDKEACEMTNSANYHSVIYPDGVNSHIQKTKINFSI